MPDRLKFPLAGQLKATWTKGDPERAKRLRREQKLITSVNLKAAHLREQQERERLQQLEHARQTHSAGHVHKHAHENTSRVVERPHSQTADIVLRVPEEGAPPEPESKEQEEKEQDDGEQEDAEQQHEPEHEHEQHEQGWVDALDENAYDDEQLAPNYFNSWRVPKQAHQQQQSMQRNASAPSLDASESSRNRMPSLQPRGWSPPGSSGRSSPPTHGLAHSATTPNLTQVGSRGFRSTSSLPSIDDRHPRHALSESSPSQYKKLRQQLDHSASQPQLPPRRKQQPQQQSADEQAAFDSGIFPIGRPPTTDHESRPGTHASSAHNPLQRSHTQLSLTTPLGPGGLQMRTRMKERTRERTMLVKNFKTHEVQDYEGSAWQAVVDKARLEAGKLPPPPPRPVPTKQEAVVLYGKQAHQPKAKYVVRVLRVIAI